MLRDGAVVVLPYFCETVEIDAESDVAIAAERGEGGRG